MGLDSRSSVRFKITIDLVVGQHTDPASDHKDPNPTTLAPHLLKSIEVTICRYMIKMSTWGFTNQ
jgi:hypothetical protein